GLNYGTKVNDFSEMAAIQKAVLDAVVNSKGSLTPNWLDAYTAVIDAYIGTPPDTFTFEGKSYTPKSFAEQVVGLDADDYVELSSFSAFPMYEPFVLPVPDNWAMASTYNVAFDDITAIIDTALHKGYTVAWATDVSEKSFSWKNG